MGEASTKNKEHKLSNYDKVRMVSSTREILLIHWLARGVKYRILGGRYLEPS
jgi:hypothetical protein